jgi:DNA-binding NarL/FixJ family response regulator
MGRSVLSDTSVALKTAARIFVTVQAADPISRLGAVCELKRHPQVELVQDPHTRPGTVTVLLAESPDESTMLRLRRLAGTDGLGVVLVASAFPEARLLKAMEYGVDVILWRHEATGRRLLQAVLAAARGDIRLPPGLGERLRTQVDEPHRSASSESAAPVVGMTPREIDVIRLVAEGLDIKMIATQLSYSERTVKKVLHDLTTRLHLRNRAHAVTYAIRNGYI